MSRRCLICANFNPCRLHSEADQSAELARNDAAIARNRGHEPSDPSPWHPEADPQRLKVLGKLAEEAAELGAALARCIIQGIDEAEPVTGKVNRVWLEDEIADVLANIHVATEHLGLDKTRMSERAARKADYIQRWLDGLTRPAPQHCDFCGAPPSVNSTMCAPPFEARAHRWTGKHPADVKADSRGAR